VAPPDFVEQLEQDSITETVNVSCQMMPANPALRLRPKGMLM
jgi:hypothetical protein